MKMKSFWIVTGLVVGIFTLACSATNDNEARNSLAGLQGVYVLVEPLPTWMEQYGATAQKIQTQVELRLRQEGIKVLSKEESDRIIGRAFLCVNVNVKKISNREECPVNCELSLRQDVYLAREQAILVGGAATWDIGSVGLCSAIQLPEFIKKSINDLLDLFVNDYLAVNPKKTSS
jgi:hypothetical protein